MANEETRRAAACRSFWSDDPLNVVYRAAIGDRPFSLSEFMRFVLALPPEQFVTLAYCRQNGGDA